VRAIEVHFRFAPKRATSPDAELIALVRQLEAIPAALDHASTHDEAWALIEQIDEISGTIVTKRATTIEGFNAKARATSWVLLEDLDPKTESSNDLRIVASLIRDLLDAHD